MQDQPAPTKAETPVVENAFPVVTPLAAEQSASAGKEDPKDKGNPRPQDKKPPAGKSAPTKEKALAATEQPPAFRDATRVVEEEIIYLNLSELHLFKNHPFGVRDDAEMQGLVESVKAAGIN